MRGGVRISGLLFHRHPSLSHPLGRLVRTQSRSAVSPEGCLFLREGNLGFLPWLQQKAGQEISSVLSIGSSVYGRSLFATRFIQAGECILKVPYSVQITRDEVPSELEPLIGSRISDIAWLALVLLAERTRGQDSEWAPYISSLPYVDDMHCLIFWSNDELEMVRPSLVYQEALHQRMSIENEFLAIKPALEHYPEVFGDISLKDFLHAYALGYYLHSTYHYAHKLAYDDALIVAVTTVVDILTMNSDHAVDTIDEII